MQMRHDDWPKLVLLFQAKLNNVPSIQRNNLAPITVFTGCPPSPPISTFIRSNDGESVTIQEEIRESILKVTQLVQFMDELHTIIQSHISKDRERSRNAGEKGELANFVDGDYD